MSFPRCRNGNVVYHSILFLRLSRSHYNNIDDESDVSSEYESNTFGIRPL
jgi:hypothetical protein